MKAKKTITIIGTITLGALGSGLWELTKPIIGSMSSLFLNLTSFGIKSIQDLTYSQIAKGFHEEAGMNILGIILSIFGGIMISVNALEYLYLTKKKIRLVARKFRKTTTGVGNSDNKDSGKQAIASNLDNLNQTPLRRKKYLLNLFILLILPTTFVDYVRFKYVNSAITHFHQVYSISSPFTDDLFKRKTISSFAQIRNRNDYILVVSKLEYIAKQNGQYIPKFDIW
jgi:hypothetical protein